MGQLIAGIDIGGTKIAGGLVDQKGHLVGGTLTVPTRAGEGIKTGSGQVLRVIERLLRQAGKKTDLSGIGFCAPGPVTPQTGWVLNPPNLPGWINLPLAKKIEDRFGRP